MLYLSIQGGGSLDSVLIVSSSNKAREFFIEVLSQNSYGEVVTVTNGGEARRLLVERIFDLCIINSPLIDEFGDEFATTLGIRLNLVRIILILSAVFLIAFATSTTGPIAFVAFLAGPIASKIVGRGSSNVLASGLVGALLVLSSDMIGQYVFSTRFPVGVITGILGAPYMLFLLICINRRGE